jgi:hypothetical protein
VKHPLWREDGLVSYEYAWPLSSLYRTYGMLLKILPLKTFKSAVSPGFAKQFMLLSLKLCYNGSLVTLTVVSLTTPKFKPLIFSLSWFTLSYATNTFILMIVYDFCFLPAQFFM